MKAPIHEMPARFAREQVPGPSVMRGNRRRCRDFLGQSARIRPPYRELLRGCEFEYRIFMRVEQNAIGAINDHVNPYSTIEKHRLNGEQANLIECDADLYSVAENWRRPGNARFHGN
ncbi:hypothetical protein [Derxia lacustris]|uniref:hypothetical protein n=1 Tax=Derxia lacustris TaxID=764842 RepID=UPI00111BEFDD|nr:hypothetical protein [Derxia lacustris]